MKPNDIYKLTPRNVTKDIFILINGWHPHLPKEFNEYDLDYEKSDRIELRIYFDPYIDGERCWVVGAAFFDDKPVMIFRHAGRGGHDYYDEFITDRQTYSEMLDYLRKFIRTEDLVVYDPDQDLPDLDGFYGKKVFINENECN